MALQFFFLILPFAQGKHTVHDSFSCVLVASLMGPFAQNVWGNRELSFLELRFVWLFMIQSTSNSGESEEGQDSV